MQAKAAFVPLDIAVGDTLLAGRFKNIPITVKEIGTDELGQPTVNGRKLLTVRIKKTMPKTASLLALTRATAKQADVRDLIMSPTDRFILSLAARPERRAALYGLLGAGAGAAAGYVVDSPWAGAAIGGGLGAAGGAAIPAFMSPAERDNLRSMERLDALLNG